MTCRDAGCSAPQREDSLASMCWPLIQQTEPVSLMKASACGPFAPTQDVKWPAPEPWRRNVGQPRCGGQGRCQGDARRCNSKYRYGVDDVGACPSDVSCRSSMSCNPCPQPCDNPCPVQNDCQRLTTRCLDWPLSAAVNAGPPHHAGLDARPPRPDLNNQDSQPSRCPTCKRLVVDMECGPLGYNY